MLSYARRAVPWPQVCAAGVLVAVLVELVRWNPFPLWPLEGTAVGLLAGASAWCFDEPAAAVVDAAPRGLRWRTAARASGVAALLLVWLVAVSHAGDALLGHATEVAVQGVVAVLGGSAWAVRRRAAGDSAPGFRAAAAAVPVATAWAVVRPLHAHAPVFPFTDGGWQVSARGWLCAGVLATAVLGLALTEVAARPGSRRPGTLPGCPDASPSSTSAGRHAGT